MNKINYLLLLIFLIPVGLFAQTTQVRGVVKDSASGNPLSGVSVELRSAKGKLAGTTTNKNGEYNLQTITPATRIVFSHTGMTTVEEDITGRGDISIYLAPTAASLGDVVVVGYTSQKKVTLTGAVSTIQGSDMVRTRNENVLNTLTGKVPGVRVVQKSSRPGAYDAAIDIRGMGQGTNPPGQPLYVVDGIVRDKDYFARMSAEEIESVSVLKDGSAAVYGLRAANGVILINTKTGKNQNGKVDITFNSSYSNQQYLYVPKGVSVPEYYTLRNESNWQNFNNNYLVRQLPVFTDAQFQPYLEGTKQSYDWMNQVFRKNTPQYANSLSVNGGSDKIRYYFNLDYTKQEGSYKSGDLESERWALRSNLDATIAKGLRAKVQIGSILTNTKEPNGSGWTTYKIAWLERPDIGFYANDNPAYYNGESNLFQSDNPLALTNADYVGLVTTRDKRYNGTVRLEWDIPWVKGLSARGLYDYSMRLPDVNNYRKAYNLYTYNPTNSTYNPALKNNPTTINKGTSMYYDRTMQGGLYYTNSFKQHNVNAFLVYEQTYSTFDGFNAQRNILVASEYLFAGEADLNQSATGQIPWDRATKSLIGSVSYDFDKKYLVDFKFRRDGSSRFPDGARFGFFPAVSVGWRIGEEGFIKHNVDWISELKLRASYGELGDDGSAGNYPPSPGYSINSNVGWYFGNPSTLTGGVTPLPIPNPNLTWYKAKSYNAGLDFGFFNNKLTGTVEVYRRDRTGLLTQRLAVIPGTVGANLPNENLNSDRNFGYEISLAYKNRYKDLSYYVSGQVTATKYMRTDWLETPANNSLDKWRNRTANRYQNIWWGQETAGMFSNIQDIRSFTQFPMGQGATPGDWYLKDWNGDGVVNNAADQHPIATMGLPVFSYGISFGGSWKNFDFALDWQGAYGVYVQYSEVLVEALSFGGQNTLSWFMDRWRPEDPNADYFSPNTKWIPGYYPVTGHDGRRTGTNGVMNASYIRLKTAEVGYTFGFKSLTKVGIKDLRLFLSGYNLLTFTGLKDVDPERPGSSGGASTDYVQFYNDPITRTFTVGLKLKF